MATVKQVRDELMKLDPALDDHQLVVWLPGSKIDLHGTALVMKNTTEVLIEGNVREGSALSS
jgi:hypothetical protein